MSWGLLITFLVWLTYMSLFSSPEVSVLPLFYCFGLFIFSALMHAILAYFVRCPHCNKCLTVQGFKKPHSASFGDWSKVVWHWFSGTVVCIHCDNRVDTNAL